MNENHPDGYLRHPRAPIGYRDVGERLRDYAEIYAPEWQAAQLRAQGERCMDCGVACCMAGCPIGNLIPDWNDLVARNRWREALARLHATNNFPEFTGYTCPAPCEQTCVLACNDQAVAIKSIERAIVDYGWEQGWIQPRRPARRSGRTVAVVGSGPAGLACAQQLNRTGHEVTVFERDDTPGGLMTYGIPDFKCAKFRVARRIRQLAQEGVQFRTGVAVGRSMSLAALRRRYDALCLTVGAQAPRDVAVPGRELEGIVYAMDYLVAENRRQAGRPVAPIDARGLHVVVLGGGDTGADCVATAHRHGARQVVQISVRDPPPAQRAPDNPWPELPRIYERSYALQEGGRDAFGLDTVAFLDRNRDGRVDTLEAERVRWRYDAQGRRLDKQVLESGVHVPADLVLIAVGFRGIQTEVLDGEAIELDGRGRLVADPCMMTTQPGVFAAGDARRGPSLVVWAIGEGRDAARHIDAYLSGSSDLPASLQTPNPPLSHPGAAPEEV